MQSSPTTTNPARVSMPLPKGTYDIIGRVNGKDVYLGRAPDEDKSVLPKGILVMPDDVKACEWQIEDLPNGTYQLKSFGSPVVAFGEMLCAVLTSPDLESSEWRLIPVSEQWSSSYLIENIDRTSRWTLPSDEPYSQVLLRPVNPGSNDVQPEESEVFRIVPDHGKV